VLSTQAPFTIHDMALAAMISELAMNATFDPYGIAQFAATFPTWASDILLYLRLDADSDTAQDGSGRDRDHVWANGTGGSRTYDGTLVPGGGQSLVGGADSGYTDADWTAMDYVGDAAGLNSQDLTYEYVATFPTLAAAQVIQEGGDGTNYWRLRVNADGSLEYQIATSAISYKFTTAAGTIVAGTQYTIQFVLSNGGQNGQFYVAERTGAYASVLTTRSAL
jgi:hypothetical protein